jgi:P27 family predicted phage terminase small subunit
VVPVWKASPEGKPRPSDRSPPGNPQILIEFLFSISAHWRPPAPHERGGMMRSGGPKPKPTVQRRLAGNPGKRPYNLEEPIPPAAGVDFDVPPVELVGNAAAGKEWGRLAPILRVTRHVTEADRNALVSMCLEWSRYLECVEAVKVKGLIIASPNGYPMPNPYLGIGNTALANCRALWPELGLTPSGRSRVKTPEPSAGDAFREFDQQMPFAAGTKH